MFKRLVCAAAGVFAVLAGLNVGCNTTPPQAPAAPVVTHLPVTTGPTSQPVDPVATLPNIQISRLELDDLLYEAYGLRGLFDIVELKMAKSALADKHLTLDPADVQRERELILTKLTTANGETVPTAAERENLFNQFLQQQHLSRAEFEIKVVQTQACLRKLVEPIYRNKLPDAMIRRGYEQLYGAKRVIQDIELHNLVEATQAHQRLKTESFEHVCSVMSIDPRTRDNGGLWEPFSAQTPASLVPTSIKDAAFSMDVGQISDILQAGTSCHIIKLVQKIEPRLVKFDDVKDDVRTQMEDQAIESGMKNVRDQITRIAQLQIQILDPVLKARWDALVNEQLGSNRDRSSALKEMNDVRAHAATGPTTVP